MASEPYGKVHAFGGERRVGGLSSLERYERALRKRERERTHKKIEELRRQMWERETKHLDKLPDQLDPLPDPPNPPDFGGLPGPFERQLRKKDAERRKKGKNLAPPKKKRRVPINMGDAFRH